MAVDINARCTRCSGKCSDVFLARVKEGGPSGWHLSREHSAYSLCWMYPRLSLGNLDYTNFSFGLFVGHSKHCWANKEVRLLFRSARLA